MTFLLNLFRNCMKKSNIKKGKKKLKYISQRFFITTLAAKGRLNGAHPNGHFGAQKSQKEIRRAIQMS